MAEADFDDANRWRQTLAALIVVALLIVVGWWVMSEMQRHRDIETCLASGRRDCVQLETVK